MIHHNLVTNITVKSIIKSRLDWDLIKYNIQMSKIKLMRKYTLNLKLFLKRDNLRGERGEVGFDVELALGVLFLD